jgi:hypothetical protein
MPEWGVIEGDGVYGLIGDPYNGLKTTKASHALSAVATATPPMSNSVVLSCVSPNRG